MQYIGAHGGEVMCFGCVQYDEISLTFTAGYMSLCCVYSHVVVFGLSVRFSWYLVWMR